MSAWLGIFEPRPVEYRVQLWLRKVKKDSRVNVVMQDEKLWVGIGVGGEDLLMSGDYGAWLERREVECGTEINGLETK